MLQNVLTKIKQGQTMKSVSKNNFLYQLNDLSFILASMVPEESITHNDEYSYGKGISLNSFFNTGRRKRIRK